eukprot:gene6529-6598_t
MAQFNWDDLRFFLSVARAGTLTLAASRIKTDHATVSRRITSLETALKTQLFERRPQGYTLTEAGARLLETAENIETQAVTAQNSIGNANLALSGVVRVAAPDGFGTLFLSHRLALLNAQYPDLTIQLVSIPRAVSVSKREADIAIVINPPEEGRLRVKKLTNYNLHFYGTADYLALHGTPSSLDDLKNHRLITYVPDLLFSSELNFMPDLFGPAYRRFECASALGQLEAVKAGAGLGILHDYSAKPEANLVRILPDYPFRRAYWIVTHADSHDLLRIRTIVDFIGEEVKTAKGLF